MVIWPHGPGNSLFQYGFWILDPQAGQIGYDTNGWGAVGMNKRVWDFILGTEDAVPGDYILALVATLGLMLAILIEMMI